MPAAAPAAAQNVKPNTPPLPSEAPTRRPSDPHQEVGTLALFLNVRNTISLENLKHNTKIPPGK